ncbi:cytochrome b/b6 domain-containing protein [Aurantiacibacter rhizosphaerae]|uniref:Polyisoprenoid-binding protein n=1 Tax=Aurantiacibacter rhizosphaerae TaxID=2691582 RepID=A0A844XI51_9SPHN|nr:cytochrome b/b6 domain-containing protein [Aurantiacibacter rhizosphaerae]MWV29393.1 polyisoprenoid-binding protein [Aurantiacibacter rhizosphaerae]
MRTTQRYSTVAIVLHWLIALALAAEIALGFAMPKDASGFAAFQLHKSIGITILALSLLRLGWRVTHARPAPIERGVTGFLAAAVHVGFYIFMIAMPLTGWALVSTDPSDIPTLLYGVVPLPHLPLGQGVNGLAGEAHELLAWGGLALFALHVVGALRHHFLIRDGLLARMGGGGFVLAMLAAVLLLGLGVFAYEGGFSQRAEHDHATDHASDHATDVHCDGDQQTLADDGHNHVHEDEAEDETADSAEDDQQDEETVAEAEPEVVEPVGPPPSWAIQPGGTLRFAIDNGGTTLKGSFANWSGSIVMDPDAPQSAKISITVDLASASLGDATQDTMLWGGDFLDTSSHAQATWRSSSVRRISGNRYEADGTLSLKGKSRPQRIVFTLNGSGKTRSVSGSATVDRKAFSVGTGSNAANLAPSVNVTFAFDAVS